MPIATTDEQLRAILQTHGRIAVVGISANPSRPSHSVAAFLKDRGYQLYLVNPLLAGQRVLGETVYASLSDLPEPPAIVDVFRRSEYVSSVVDDAISVGAKVLWTQLGVHDPESERRASEAGLQVVEDRCTAIEYARLRPQLPPPPER